jgi:DNA-binding Xre family transcriptional regulator
MARPRGWKLNRSAFDDLLIKERTSKTEVACVAGLSPQMIGDMYGAKRAGASAKTARQLADALRCDVGTLFPEAAGFCVAEV